MKQFTAIALFSIVTCIATSSATAQRRGYSVNPTVPFAFSVGDKTLPSGTYKVSSPRPGLVQIQSSDHRVTIMTLISSNVRESDHGCKLVFNRYNDQYFLHDVLCPGIADGEIPTSKSETNVRLREEASLSGNHQIEISAR